MRLAPLEDHTALKKVRTALAPTGAELFVVGGAVRDAIIGRPIKDLDVVVRNIDVESLETTLATVGKVDLVGKRFAIFKILVDQTMIDVALPRTDASFNTGRYQDVAVRADPSLSVGEDLKRRDFTVNAMAWNVTTGELVDPYLGREDLEHRRIRCVGSPDTRIQEDATRILRALRFAAQLHFTIETITLDAIRKSLGLLASEKVTPREVIAAELVKGFTADPTVMLDLLEQSGILDVLLPELKNLKDCQQPPEFHAEGDVWNHTRLALAALEDISFRATFGAPPTAQLIITTLLHDIGKPPTRKTPERDGSDRIRFEGHAEASAEMAKNLATRLKLESAGIDVDDMAWAIHHHLDILNLEKMRPSTLEQTFLEPKRGELLRQLCWADNRATLSPEDVTNKETFREPKAFERLEERLLELRQRGYEQDQPKALLTGDDIKQALKLTGGPGVGDVIKALRDAQLDGRITTREQALAFIKTFHASDHRG